MVKVESLKDHTKLFGFSGILAAVIFLIALIVSILTSVDWTLGINHISELGFNSGSSLYYMIGCISAGIISLIFAFGNFIRADNIFGKFSGILLFISGVFLILLGIITTGDSNDSLILIFYGLAIISVASSAIADFKSNATLNAFISGLFTVILLVLVYVSGDGLLFAVLLCIWVIFQSIMFLAPPVDVVAKPKATPAKKVKAESKPSEKSKPAPAKAKPTPAKPKPVPAKSEPKEEEKAEKPVEEAPIVEATPEPKLVEKKIASEPEKPSEEVKPLRPKIAFKEQPTPDDAIRRSETKPTPEPVKTVSEKEDSVVEKFTEPVTEKVEVIEEKPVDDEFTDNSPEALVRRACWNKGLRCRRGYGDHNIPVAFVKGKVAVFVEPKDADQSKDAILVSEGWNVFRYDETTISNGETQAEEIVAKVKENLRASKTKKKK